MRYIGNTNITVWFFIFWCWTFVTRFFIHKLVYYTALIFIFDFCRQISHHFKNQEQTNFDLLLQRFFLLVFFQNGKTKYNYVYVLPNIFMKLFLIAQSNLTYSLLSKISTSHRNNARVSECFFSKKVPGLSNQCKFELANVLAGRFISRYWVRYE